MGSVGEDVQVDLYPNPEDTLRQLETVAPLDGEAETFRRELVRLYASSVAAGAALSIRED